MRFTFKYHIILFISLSMLFACSNIESDPLGDKIDLTTDKLENVLVLSTPDPSDESLREIILPEFEKFVHVAADSNQFRWIGASNRMFPWVGGKELKSIFEPKDPVPPRIPQPNRRALTMLFQLTNGNYLTLLPLAGDVSISWLEITEDGRLVLDYGTLGTQSVPQDSNVPLLAWYESESMYESLFKTWELVLEHKSKFASASLRDTKEYSEPLKYLGWCTWEQYKKTINEEILVNAIDNIEKSGVPVRWFLIDDGHQNDKKNKLISYEPNSEKFPNGWDPITSRKSDDGIKWMGIWHGFLSHWNGVHVDHTMPGLSTFLMPNPKREDGLLPKDDMESSQAFYDYMISTLKDQNFDFMKTDNVSRSTIEYYGSANPAMAQMQNVLSLEEACLEQGFGLMNCSAQNTIDMLNAKSSATMRTSPDYIKHDLATSKSQILQSVFNVLWLGQTLWPDHDMFHSSDTEVGETMAVTKALSGGPIYLSDDPAEFNSSVIEPLSYDDGKLIRPLAPGVPMTSSIFNDALYENQEAYKTIAPLKNASCAIAAYNLSVTASEPLMGKIDKSDYKQAGAMIQPFAGLWEQPEEGLVIYDWNSQQGQVLSEEGLQFEIDGFGHKLFLLIPIIEGWAVIGRTDKYLSPSTFEIQETTDNELTLTMHESGDIVLYSSTGELQSDHFDLMYLGNDFYKAAPKEGVESDKFKISR
ncbi:Sip1-related alpha-galactosidase [Flagellimonas marina]|uniref:Sip1-related alpha-galactosidase n=1 Tax=Flagellimonas marina TaxID=1775168 RepID=A0ABV8PSC3_9FLAO